MAQRNYTTLKMKSRNASNSSTFRYIYNWFTRCPRVIFIESVQRLKKAIGSDRNEEHSASMSSDQSKSRDPLNQEKDVPSSLPWTEMTDDGGCCAVVVALVAQRRVKYFCESY